MVLFAGYPESKSRFDAASKDSRAYAHGVVRPAVPPERLRELGYDPAFYIGVELDLRKPMEFIDEAARHFPRPKGMSGAPLWGLTFLEGSDVGLRLAGLGIRHLAAERLLIFTRIKYVVEAIQDPGAREAELTAPAAGVQRSPRSAIAAC